MFSVKQISLQESKQTASCVFPPQKSKDLDQPAVGEEVCSMWGDHQGLMEYEMISGPWEVSVRDNSDQFTVLYEF